MLDTEKIERLRREKNITRQELAESIGVSNAMMTYIMQGKRRPSLDATVMLASTLGCTVDDILRG